MFFIFETHATSEGGVNIEPVVVRSSLASGLSYYYERKSKMVMTELYPSVSIMITDANLNVVEQDTINTLYNAD